MFQYFDAFLWYFSIQILGLLSFPIMFHFFDKNKDHGYGVSKIFGILFFTFLIYFITRFLGFKFNFLTTISASLIFFLLSLLSLFSKKAEISKKLKSVDFRKTVVIFELVFLLTLSLALFLRSHRPDMDRGEAPMDFSYINSALRTEKLPPPYPWHAGTNLEKVYYYFGHFSFACLTMLTQIPSSITYNLALCTVFALIALSSFSIGYNLTGKFSFSLLFMILLTFSSNIFSLLHTIEAIFPDIDLYVPDHHIKNERDFWYRLFYGDTLFWWGTRVIVWTITEFPWFSLLWGDLHAHYMSFPFIMLLAHLILNIFRSENTGLKIFGKKWNEAIFRIFILAVVIGFMLPQFVWNYPICIMFLGLAIFGSQFYNKRKVNFKEFFKISLVSIFTVFLVVSLSFILYHPVFFNLFSTKRTGLRWEELKTSLYHFSLLFFLPLSLMFFYLIKKIYSFKTFENKLNKKILLVIIILYFLLMAIVYFSFFENPVRFNRQIKIKLKPYMLLDFQLLLIFIPFVTIPLIIFFSRKFKNKDEVFLLITILSGTFVVILYELASIYGRYIFVFKLHTFVWIFWNISAAYIIYYFRDKLNFRNLNNSLYTILLSFLIFVCVAIYLFVTTYVEYNKLQPSYGRKERTLDTLEYLNITNKPEYDAIMWLNQNVKGQHVILEYPGHSYEFYPRPSSFTGMMTVLEWRDHAAQLTQSDVNPRFADVNTTYLSEDNDETLRLLQNYGVEYIYIGGLEKASYERDRFEKFDNYPEYYEKVYENDNVVIYKIKKYI